MRFLFDNCLGLPEWSTHSSSSVECGAATATREATAALEQLQQLDQQQHQQQLEQQLEQLEQQQHLQKQQQHHHERAAVLPQVEQLCIQCHGSLQGNQVSQ